MLELEVGLVARTTTALPASVRQSFMKPFGISPELVGLAVDNRFWIQCPPAHPGSSNAVAAFENVSHTFIGFLQLVEQALTRSFFQTKLDTFCLKLKIGRTQEIFSRAIGFHKFMLLFEKCQRLVGVWTW